MELRTDVNIKTIHSLKEIIDFMELIHWIMKGVISYLRAKNNDAFKLYNGRDVNKVTGFSVVLNPIV